ncbi:MAG: hypothetical protein SYC29_04440 [Planctomycetota bacterium]|nr:hypothetical protein [Planctomycetota bacterium]
MSEEQKPLKICAICGEDCSQQRRIKDQQGRYYHKDCYEQAKQAERAKRAAAQSAPASSSMPLKFEPSAEPDPYALDSDVMEESGSGSGMELDDTGQETKVCPHCHRRMPVEHATCSHCGYNTLTGDRKVSTFAEMAAARVGKTGGGKIWPPVVGILSLLAGVGGLFAYGLALIAALREHGAGTFIDITHVVALGIGTLLALWVLIAAIGVLRKRQMAMVWMQRWALLKLFCGIVAFIALVVAILFVSDFDTRIDAEFDTKVAGEGIVAFLTFGLPWLGWILLWPIGILVWFSRESVQRQVGEWD